MPHSDDAGSPAEEPESSLHAARPFYDSAIASLVALLLGLGLLLPMAGASYYIFRTESRVLTEEFRAEQGRIGNILAHASSSLLWNLQRNVASASLDAFMRDERVCTLRIRDALGGGIFVERRQPAHCGGDLSQTSTPIRNQNAEIGSVEVVMSDTLLRQHIRRRMWELLALFVVQLLLVTAVLLPALLCKVIRPLRRLAGQADRLSRGSFDEAFVWRRHDEIGQVGRALEQARRQLHRFVADQQSRHRALEVRARTDPLTGLPNRLRLDEELQRWTRQNQRQGDDFGAILVDVDHFKAVNDEHGHLVGDEVLVEFGRLLRLHLREGDLVGRWGGEEFLILCPGSRPDGMLRLAQLLQETIAGHVFPHGLHCTASFGVAACRRGENGPEALLLRVDKALYRAKLDGRNRVVVA